jgi:hypothetical protein
MELGMGLVMELGMGLVPVPLLELTPGQGQGPAFGLAKQAWLLDEKPLQEPGLQPAEEPQV